MIIEQYPPLPPKPQDVIIERWLPNPPRQRRILYERLPPMVNQPVPTGPIIIQHGQPRVRVHREVRTVPGAHLPQQQILPMTGTHQQIFSTVNPFVSKFFNLSFDRLDVTFVLGFIQSILFHSTNVRQCYASPIKYRCDAK